MSLPIHLALWPLAPRQSWWRQLRLIGFVYVIPVLAIAFAATQTFVKPDRLFRDPTAILDGQPYVGIISSAGILLWCTTAVMCLFSALTLRRNHYDRRVTQVLFITGSLTMVLLVDDLFLIHETLTDDYLHVSDVLIMLVYLSIGIVYVGLTGRILLRSENGLLLVAGMAFFIISLVTDGFRTSPTWLEDGAKLLGIVSWCVYFCIFSSNHLQQLISQGKGVAT